MNSDSRRKASAAYHAKREAEGLKKVTLWLSPEARSKLDALKAVAGSKDKAADAAILAWSPLAVEPDVAAVLKRLRDVHEKPGADQPEVKSVAPAKTKATVGTGRIVKPGPVIGAAPGRFVDPSTKSPLVVDGDLAVATKSFTTQAGQPVTLQLGPTPRKYGDLAKKGKGK